MEPIEVTEADILTSKYRSCDVTRYRACATTINFRSTWPWWRHWHGQAVKLLSLLYSSACR